MTELHPRRDVGPDGEPVSEFDAFLDIDRVPAGKRFQGVWLEAPDASYVVTYRPDPAFFPYQEKRVRVRGYVEHIPPHVQHIGASHFVVDSIRIADGESAHDPVPTDLLAPRVVSTPEGLAEARGRWVQLVGTLKGSEPNARGGSWVDALIEVEGVVVRVMLADHVFEKNWEALVGKTMTVVGVVRAGDEARLRGSNVLCEGADEECWSRSR